MIGVIVTFQYDGGLDRERLLKIASEAAPRFEGMAGLRSKVFTLDERGARATNVYIWDSEDAARAFFDDALVERVTSLYGVRPSVDFVEIAALVENA
jgi:heme-degrading monooxygenase HmoA